MKGEQPLLPHHLYQSLTKILRLRHPGHTMGVETKALFSFTIKEIEAQKDQGACPQ